MISSDDYANLMVMTYRCQQKFERLVTYHIIYKRPLLLRIFALLSKMLGRVLPPNITQIQGITDLR